MRVLKPVEARDVRKLIQRKLTKRKLKVCLLECSKHFPQVFLSTSPDRGMEVQVAESFCVAGKRETQKDRRNQMIEGLSSGPEQESSDDEDEDENKLKVGAMMPDY